MVRETIVLMLEDAFDVVLAVSVATALVQLGAAHPRPIDVVLLDCHLPDGKFDNIIAEADLLSISVVLMSGDVLLRDRPGLDRIFLSKPFSWTMLLSVLDSTLRVVSQT